MLTLIGHPEVVTTWFQAQTLHQLGHNFSQIICSLSTHNTFFGASFFEAVHQGLTAEAIIDQTARRAQFGKRQQGEHELGTIFHQYRHAVTPLDAPRLQHMCQLVNLSVELTVSPLTTLK